MHVQLVGAYDIMSWLPIFMTLVWGAEGAKCKGMVSNEIFSPHQGSWKHVHAVYDVSRTSQAIFFVQLGVLCVRVLDWDLHDHNYSLEYRACL